MYHMGTLSTVKVITGRSKSHEMLPDINQKWDVVLCGCDRHPTHHTLLLWCTMGNMMLDYHQNLRRRKKIYKNIWDYNEIDSKY